MKTAFNNFKLKMTTLKRAVTKLFEPQWVNFTLLSLEKLVWAAEIHAIIFTCQKPLLAKDMNDFRWSVRSHADMYSLVEYSSEYATELPQRRWLKLTLSLPIFLYWLVQKLSTMCLPDPVQKMWPTIYELVSRVSFPSFVIHSSLAH